LKKITFVSAGLILLITGVFLSRGEFKNSSIISSFNTMLDGAQTCFLRVNQSYSARMIGLESAYLKKDFLSQTESCFTELKQLISKNESLIKLSELTESISDEVYWFHRQQDFENPFTETESGGSDDYQGIITGKFKKIEKLHEVIVDNIKERRDILLKKQSSSLPLKVLFILVLTSTLIFLLKLFLQRQSMRSSTTKFLSRDNIKDSIAVDLSAEQYLQQSSVDTKTSEETSVFQEEKKEKLSSEVPGVKPSHNYGIELGSIIRELTPLFFNLNTSINFGGVQSLKFSSEVNFSKEAIKEFLRLIIRFSLGGKYPVQIEFSKFKKGSDQQLKVSATNTNFCLYLDRDLKDSISGLKEIVTHDNIVLGFCLESSFEDKLKTSNLNSVFVGQKKDLLKKIKNQSLE